MDVSLKSNFKNWLLISTAWWIFAVATVFATPYHQGFQLHYLSVAWEMFNNHNYLMTYASGQIDLEKTPLFYWLIVGGWHLFGVSNAWPRILTFGIGWINLLLTWWLARQIFANKIIIAWLSVIILAASIYWPIFAGEIRFENLVTLFGLLFLNFLLKASQTDQIKYWLLSGFSFGLALFSKGLVAGIYFLPFVLTMPYWSDNIKDKQKWYLKLAFIIIAALLIPISWICAVAIKYGMSAVHYLIFGQVGQRVNFTTQFIKNIEHGMSLLMTLPLRFLPWILLPVLWVQFKDWHQFADKKFKALLLSSLGILLFFTLFVNQQMGRYFIPIFPQLAMILAIILASSDKLTYPRLTLYFLAGLYILAGVLLWFAPYLPLLQSRFPALQPVSALWGLGIILGSLFLLIFKPHSILNFCILVGAIFFFELTFYQLSWQRMLIKPMGIEPIAKYIENLPHKEQGLVQFGFIPTIENFEFLARLEQPLLILKNDKEEEQRQWLKNHPSGQVISTFSQLPLCQQTYKWWQIRQNRILTIMPVKNYLTCERDFR